MRNGDGSPAEQAAYEESVVAYDEALRTGGALPGDEAKVETFDPKVRERLSSAKECLRLIEPRAAIPAARDSSTAQRRCRQFWPRRVPTRPAGRFTASDGSRSSANWGGEVTGLFFWPAIRPSAARLRLKVPRPEAILTPQLRIRFLREGEGGGALNHPNILPVHEAGEAGPICYLVQSYCSGSVPGGLVSAREESCPLRSGRADRGRAGRRRRSRAPAGHSAPRHQAGQCDAGDTRGEGRGQRGGGERKVPRICDSDWRCFVPRLTDFGLAKASTTIRNATATLGAIGTATYMPPEQARGEQTLVGPRSDVYSLGALLYELLTRRPPIAGVNQLDTLRLIASEDPRPVRELRSDVPRELEAICLKCLEKSPDARVSRRPPTWRPTCGGF